tara:strand:+ start:14187 stop:16898 length:2712 start_codon:yes stop_codon:yes gene_type:complete
MERQQNRLSLSGQWKFSFGRDTDPATDLNDTISLPGTMDLNHKGNLNSDTTTLHLNRIYKYTGPAWYQKTVTIPESFAGMHVELFLERTKSTWVWIDSTFAGNSHLLQSPHRYDVSDLITPGEHTITLKIDNSQDLTPYRETHIFSDETQTNWNGVIGEMYLEARPKTFIRRLRTFPDIKNQQVLVEINIENGSHSDSAFVDLKAELRHRGRTIELPLVSTKVKLAEVLSIPYQTGEQTRLWDEYDQPLYTLTAVLKNESFEDFQTVTFGMREFNTNQTQFTINDRTTFLRGKHDAAVFPETGHTPTDVDSWMRVFEIAKSWGINHYRFHSYTPPEAAFEAADRTGIYLQTELPFWGGLENYTAKTMLLDEGLALLDEYGNHPSLVMVSHGNEIWSGHDNVEENIRALKKHDPRPLYAMGSNNNIGYVWPREVEDFRVSSRTPSNGDHQKTHLRLTHAFVDSDDGGILNTQIPSTRFDFSFPVSEVNIPMISHEIGQYQIYPDYDEIEKYTGPVRAWNLEKFRESLQDHGMSDQDSLFQKASGAWAAIAYKAEMEAAIRTPGMAGFQLLDLQDFPGQGTALVGVLDAFMDDKRVVERNIWRQSCNDVVLLAEFNKYAWATDETYSATIEVANYSNQDHQSLSWSVSNSAGTRLASGDFRSEFAIGGVGHAGVIELVLKDIKAPQQLTLNLRIPDTEYVNQYPIWVYPSESEIELNKGEILITDSLNETILSSLEKGSTVLFFPDGSKMQDRTVGGLFPPNFWNYEMFKGISESNDRPYSPGTLGLLMDPDHPIFKNFPTDFHTNWQWFSIVKASHPMILDETLPEYRPVIQVIDNLQRNHKLGLVFEFRVGKGKLLISMADLRTISDRPEAKQFYASILNYMRSDEFEPTFMIEPDTLSSLFN